MFFSEPKARFCCLVSCTGVELEKPLISNPDTSNYSREPLKLIVFKLVIGSMSVSEQLHTYPSPNHQQPTDDKLMLG